MRVAIYSRKSVYTGKGESIENQIKMCRQYIASKIKSVIAEDVSIYEDEGFSAKNVERPQFQKLLRDVRNKQYDYVVCYRLDRISRNVGDFANLVEEMNKLGVSLVCVKEEFDTSKPMGKAMMYIASVFAQLERETLAERVRDNMFLLARSGRWLGGTPPTGFNSERIEKVDVDGNVRTACKLKTDPRESGVVKTIFEKFLELQSLSGVSKHLIRTNARSRKGKRFSLLGIKEILSNPVYCVADGDARKYFVSHDSDVCFREEECSSLYGLLAYNKRDYKKKHAPRHNKSEWIIAIGKHEGVVEGKKWVMAQEILESNKPSNRQVKARNEYSLLSGMVICLNCGSKMFVKMRRNAAAGTPYDYICNGKMRGGTGLCDCKNLNGRQTDDLVCDYLMRYGKEDANILALLEGLKKDLRKEGKANPLLELDKEIAQCKDEMERLLDALAQREATQALVKRVNARVSQLDEELARLSAKREGLRSEKNFAAGGEGKSGMAESLSDFPTCFKEMSVPEKRSLIKAFLPKMEWDGESLHLYFYTDEDRANRGCES